MLINDDLGYGLASMMTYDYPAYELLPSTKFSTHDPFTNIIMPKRVKNLIILYLPIEDILKFKIIAGNDDNIQLHRLLHASDQNQLYFRFTSDMERVWTRPHMLQLGIKYNDCNRICAKLGKFQRRASELSAIVTTKDSGLQASTRDYANQDIDRTLDGKLGTFWSSEGSTKQNKVDWLLYDLGTVTVITRISISACRLSYGRNKTIHGFKTCWIELGFNSEKFHYKTKVFTSSNTSELQHFTMRKHLENRLPAARYIKFWMQGCHQKHRSDNLWYFVINRFEVRAIPLECFPDPVPKTLKVLGNLKSKSEEWLEIDWQYQRFVQWLLNCFGEKTNRKGVVSWEDSTAKTRKPVCRVGDVLMCEEGLGVVRYVGPVEKDFWLWSPSDNPPFFGFRHRIGLELRDSYKKIPKGVHNGTWMNKFYYSCPEDKGLFIREEDIIKSISSEDILHKCALMKTQIGKLDEKIKEAKAQLM